MGFGFAGMGAECLMGMMVRLVAGSLGPGMRVSFLVMV